MLKELKETRDMSVSEVKLTLAIEDASVREQKEYMGIEVRCRGALPSLMTVTSPAFGCRSISVEKDSSA